MSDSAGDSATIVISKNTINRLIRDIRSLKTDPLTEHGIHYHHSETDILKGQALIIGPPDTPYTHGFYLFDFTFPSDYPHRPPEVKFCTNDGVTRMNPNLYKNGKVCVSILNTWRGDAWTGCQTISTILLTLVSLLNNQPLLNEPGISIDHSDFLTYNHIIRYKNFETAIYLMLTSESIKKHYYWTVEIMEKYFLKNYDNIIKQVHKYAKICPEILNTSIYRMHITPNYEYLLDILNDLNNKLAKLK